jgi:hypothetical protein
MEKSVIISTFWKDFSEALDWKKILGSVKISL